MQYLFLPYEGSYYQIKQTKCFIGGKCYIASYFFVDLSMLQNQTSQEHLSFDL